MNKGGRVCLFSTKQNDDLIVIQNERFEFRQVLTLDAHANSYQHPGTRGVDGPPPPRVFDLLQYFETPLILFTR